MSERIDHAAEAAAHLDGLRSSDPWRSIATAQVHATLALVEQARIANLIALAQFRAEGDQGKVLTTQFDLAIELRAEAAYALGVSDD